MAEGLFKKMAPQLQVSSAGVMALVGHGADPIAVQIMSEKGIDISSHRARMLTEAIIRDVDLVLTMDSMLKSHILAEHPYMNGRVFRLAESTNQEITDPFQRGYEEFLGTFSVIEYSVNDWVERIRIVN